MKTCPICGNINLDDGIFCGRCGESIAHVPSQSMEGAVEARRLDDSSTLGFHSSPQCFICGASLPSGKLTQLWSNPHIESVHPEWYRYHKSWKTWFRRFLITSVLALVVSAPVSLVTKYYFYAPVAMAELLLVVAFYQIHQWKFYNFRFAWEREHGKIH